MDAAFFLLYQTENEETILSAEFLTCQNQDLTQTVVDLTHTVVFPWLRSLTHGIFLIKTQSDSLLPVYEQQNRSWHSALCIYGSFIGFIVLLLIE